MRSIRAIVFLSLAAAVCSCAAKKAGPKGSSRAAAPGGAAEPAIRGGQYGSVADLQTVHFDYDVDRLGREEREILKRNAAVIKRNADWEVLVEGHCDERGTVEYNLALGQRRAKAVRDYYLDLGVPGGKVATLSYGRESPACAEPTEGCRARNRRAPSKVKTTIAKKPG